jgi:hypothetical protein
LRGGKEKNTQKNSVIRTDLICIEGRVSNIENNIKGRRAMKTSLMTCICTIVLIFICTGCYEEVYNVEWKGDSCIKFEDAMYEIEPDVWVEDCLGEDGAVEADYFYVELDGYTEDIEVSVKAGKCKEQDVPLVWSVIQIFGEDVDVLEGSACGFTIYAYPYEDGCELVVLSDDIEGGKDGTAALSNVTFCFGDGVMVIGPEEGEFETGRADEEEINEVIGDGD